MKSGQSLEKLTPLQVIRVMRRMSGLGLGELATAMDRNMRTVGCWFGEGSPDKFIPVPLVPRFCHVMRSPLLIEWQMAQFERLQRGEPADIFQGAAADRIIDLVLRGIVQSSQALDLLRDAGGALTPSQGRQAAEAILLAVSTLAEAAREAREVAPEFRANRYFLAKTADEREPDPAAASPRASWWRRLVAWWIRDDARELEALRADYRDARRLLGAMGWLLREVLQSGRLRPSLRRIAGRLLDDGMQRGAKERIHG